MGVGMPTAPVALRRESQKRSSLSGMYADGAKFSQDVVDLTSLFTALQEQLSAAHEQLEASEEEGARTAAERQAMEQEHWRAMQDLAAEQQREAGIASDANRQRLELKAEYEDKLKSKTQQLNQEAAEEVKKEVAEVEKEAASRVDEALQEAHEKEAALLDMVQEVENRASAKEERANKALARAAAQARWAKAAQAEAAHAAEEMARMAQDRAAHHGVTARGAPEHQEHQGQG